MMSWWTRVNVEVTYAFVLIHFKEAVAYAHIHPVMSVINAKSVCRYRTQQQLHFVKALHEYVLVTLVSAITRHYYLEWHNHSSPEMNPFTPKTCLQLTWDAKRQTPSPPFLLLDRSMWLFTIYPGSESPSYFIRLTVYSVASSSSF